MLPVTARGERGPLIVMLHWLGGSADTWTEVSEGLVERGFRCAALDLPGFGQAVDIEAFTVEQMMAAVIDTIHTLRGSNIVEPWFLAGHSMGGKLAATVARASADMTPGLEGLSGIVLVSPSPPGVEPMKESKRRDAIENLGKSTADADQDRKHAEGFVADNVGKMTLTETVHDRTVRDVLRMNRNALVAWMTTGSKEDWASRVGTLSLPALILAGMEEAALNPEAQSKHTLPYFPNSTLVSLQGSGHLSPVERPWELVEYITDFARSAAVKLAPPSTALSAEFAGLIQSGYTSPQTRVVLNDRLKPATMQTLGAFNTEELHTLRALVRCVVPHAAFDLAARLNEQLGQSKQDGSRHDTLPADAKAWRKGLASLEADSLRNYGVPFVALDEDHQTAMLEQARSGELGKGVLGTLHIGDAADIFTAAEMRDWFEEVRGEMAKLYVADPRTMQRIGFTGFADDRGFTQIRLNETEPFELYTTFPRDTA